MTKRKYDTKYLVILALFCALAYATRFFFKIEVMFLTFDVKDAVTTLAAMLFGPLSGLIISLVIATLEAITISTTGIYGFIMNFASSAVFCVVASSVYRSRRKISFAIFGLFTAVVSTTTVMMLLNLLITPLFTKTSIDDVLVLIPKLLLPFNLTKATLNAALVLILYKPISEALKRAKLIDTNGEQKSYNFGVKSIILLLAGLLLTALCIFIMINILGGKITF